MGALYFYAENLFTLVHEDLDWEVEDPLYVT